MNNIIIAIIMAFTLIVSGCATTQRTFDSAAISQIVPKKSTKDDVKRLLGGPKTINTSSAGLDTWIYSETGRTTGNEFSDSFRRVAAPMDMMLEGMKNMDILTITFRGNVVQDIQRSSTSSP